MFTLSNLLMSLMLFLVSFMILFVFFKQKTSDRLNYFKKKRFEKLTTKAVKKFVSSGRSVYRSY
jgi:hypothetical protein